MVKRLKIALIKYVLRKKRKKLMKKNLIGERFIVPRVGLDGVEWRRFCIVQRQPAQEQFRFYLMYMAEDL